MQFQSLSFILNQDCAPHFFWPVLESLKVIAFDKNSVNTYLSPEKLFPYITNKP